jgi:predicted ATPase/transcriptional regulator with XRE-family HTH domain
MDEVFSFGEWVRQRRRALDLTQDELARRVGCTVSMLRKIELDERRPSKQLAALLADGLELPDAERADFSKVARAALAADRLAVPAVLSPSAPLIMGQPSAPSHGLPAPPTALIGREHDLAWLRASLEQPGTRLVTLTGPGGTGKTRLALQLAMERAAHYADDALFIDLAPLVSADQVLGTIAHALGVRELVGTSLHERVCEYLQPKQSLLLLDNFEHVLDAAPLVAELLRAAARLTVLVTSRVVLHLSGEHEYAVPPLAVPDPQLPPIPEQIARASAVQLFVERAQAVKPAFALTEANAASVAAICWRLDGLPLAMELAAVRVKLFPPEMLLERLNNRLRLLTGGARDLPARQQTLRATIDWSYNLLAPAEQRLFRRLAVFVGGWTLEAATAVCDVEGDLGLDMLDGLQVLLDHSLARQEARPDGAVRFRYLETIREYARELLATSGEEVALQRRHAMSFLDLAEQAEKYKFGAEDFIWGERLIADYDNLNAALVWSKGATGDTAIALRLVAALLEFWLNCRPLSEGYHWIETILALPREEGALPDVWANMLNTAGTVALFKGDVLHAEPLLTQALALFESLADDRGCSEVLNHLGILKAQTGHLAQSVAYQEASLQQAQQAQSEVRIAWALSALGRAHMFQGHQDLAVKTLEESLAIGALHRDSHHVVCVILAKALSQRGDDARAIALLDEALPILRAASGAVFTCTALTLRACIAREHGDDTAAEALLREGLTLAHNNGAGYQLARIHYEIGHLTLNRGDILNAQAHFQESLTLFRAQQNPWLVANALLGAGVAALAIGDRETAHQHYCASLALLRDWRENMLARQAAMVAGLVGLAVSSALESATAAVQAVRIWGIVAEVEPLTAGRRVTPPFLRIPRPDPALRDAAVQAAKALLGDIVLAAAWAAGQALTLEQAVVQALEEGQVH